MIGGIDLSNLIQLEPELVQEYYDNYGMSNYAQPMLQLIEIAKGNPESRSAISIKNTLQFYDVLPPDDKEVAIEKLISIGVKPKDALTEVNKLRPVKSGAFKGFYDSIRKKIPSEEFALYKEFLTSLESING